MLRNLVLCVLIGLVFHATACGDAARPSTIEWFDLAAWDDAQIISSGQSFTAVHQDIDLNVTASGGSRTTVHNGRVLVVNGNIDVTRFTFEFSHPIDVVFEINSLDPEELISLAADGSEGPTYFHLERGEPIQTGNLTLQGGGFGFDSEGSSHGWIAVEDATIVTLDYQAAAINKFETIGIGGSVPEPSASLLLLMAFGPLLFTRPRRPADGNTGR